METDDWLRPLPDACEHLETGLGDNVLSRVLLTNARPGDKQMLNNTIEEDLAHAGSQGLLSLIRSLIKLGEFTRLELLEFSESICGAGTLPVFEELLDLFEGDRPHRDIWSRSPDGRYRLNYWT